MLVHLPPLSGLDLPYAVTIGKCGYEEEGSHVPLHIKVDGAKTNTLKTYIIEYILIMRIFTILTSDFHVGFGSFINKILNLYILESNKMYVGGLESMSIVN